MLPNPTPIPFPIQWIDIPVTNWKRFRAMNPDMIVIHITEGSKQATINQFQNPSTQVSSHFLVNRDGSITQFVGTGDTAFANGVLTNPVSQLVVQRIPKNPNDYTISIEHEGFDNADLTPIQYSTSSKLVKFLSQKWNIPLDTTHIIGHRQITGTKTCPSVINIEQIIRGAKYGP